MPDPAAETILITYLHYLLLLGLLDALLELFVKTACSGSMTNHDICFNSMRDMNAFEQMDHVQGEQSWETWVQDFNAISKMILSLENDVFLEEESLRNNLHVVVFIDLQHCRIFIDIVCQWIYSIFVGVSVQIESYLLSYRDLDNEILHFSLFDLKHVLVKLMSVVSVSPWLISPWVEHFLPFSKLFVLLMTDSLSVTEFLLPH